MRIVEAIIINDSEISIGAVINSDGFKKCLNKSELLEIKADGICLDNATINNQGVVVPNEGIKIPEINGKDL